MVKIHTMNKQHLMSVEQIIKDTIVHSGPVTFERFMEMALYYPSMGYYTSGRQRLGKEGDYYTAPYASSLMGMIIEKQLEQFFRLLGSPAPFYIVEVGGGSGKMADDIVESAYRWHRGFYETLNYVIIEKHRTQEIEHTEKISVFETLSALKPIIGCIISNELFDALPVHIVVMKDRLYEVYVDVQNDQFKEILIPASEELVTHFEFIGIKPVEGMWTEVNLQAKKMIESMSSILEYGYILTIDYGYTANEYYAPHRTNGTLVCYHNHRIDDNPYEFVGEKDITAHVDFTSLARWGRMFSLNTIGYVKQRDFILAVGYNDLLANIKNTIANPVDYYRLTSASKFLIMPDAMGDIFKVLLQYKGIAELPLPMGFVNTKELL
jgi:SAM-dependent MidA family methyltransferase